MGQITWRSVFNPEAGSWHPGGIDSLTRGAVARLFDDFESYADDTAIQAVWSVTNGAVGDPRLTTAANAIKGRQSLQVTATGGVGVVSRAIPNNTFGFPVGSRTGRIRYVAFKGIVTSGSETIRVRLADASDATLYKEWQFTLAQNKTQEFIIDLYSGSTSAITGGGFLNTESYPAPIAEGATAWNPTLIDQFSFRNLTQNSVFRFDDVRFYYEYSLLDAIGLGTEPSTDDGADGSVQSKLRYLNNLVLQKIGETQQYSKYSPGYVKLNNAYTFGLELKSGLAIPSTTEITPGNYVINRIRNGTTTEIVASTTADEAAGFISATYTPLEDNWQLGDQLTVTFSGGYVDKDTDTAELLTANANATTTTITVANAALFQAGQRVRIYDDTPDTEIQTIVSIDSPTTLTVGALANNYTTAANARIVLVERTNLETARIAVNVTYEPEITQEVERWVLADYDDFDFADADGNNERWDVGYIANSDGSAAGAEGGSADINTTTAGQARVAVDPDVTPTQSAYAIKKDEPTRSKYFSIVVDADVALSTAYATSTFAGLRVSAGDVDDPSNYILVAREASNAVNRITARAEFMGAAQTTANFSTTDNAVAFKIERYNNVWNIFYSLTQYPNWVWTKLTQFEDANGDMSSSVSVYLYAESGGTDDAQIVTADFDNFKYYISSGAIDQILSTLVLASGTFTTSSTSVPADTGRTEGNDYWNGTLLMPITGVAAAQPRVIVDFANAGGVFTIDPQQLFTIAPAVGDEYVILADQHPLRPATDAGSNYTVSHVVGSKTDTADYTFDATASSLVRLVKGILGATVIREGTFTTSSATVPADTGRTEANDVWNGCWLMPISGAIYFQPRLIVDFANAGGVFTLDSEQPFSAAPGLVGYVILRPSSPVMPAADSTNNQTPSHAIGNKSDAASVVAGNASIIGRLRAIEAALSVNAAAGGEFELDGDPDLWDALVNNSSADASITTTTGNRDAAVIQRLAAIINAHGITDAATATGYEEDGTGGTLWESIVAVKGTFTTSSATVPADTGRAEANDFFNGDIIIPLSGAVVRQARLIVDFANAGGVFTIDPENPFTAAPGLVDYVVLHFQQPLVPAADSANNSTTAHVVGNKTDTIPAMNAAPGNDSAVRHLKAILERIGATPADPDDSVLTNLGQRDDAATADDLSDVTSTSIEAKLRRLLLRFSADAFSATVQGVARTDIENMVQGLANYLSSAGAAWSVTADPGGAARDNLEQTLEDLAAVLAGSGMTTFPVRAVAADGVSIAEVLRHASESIGENTANNVFDSSSVVVNEDGSVLERLEGISQDLSRSEYLLADYDDFDVADADANTERWNSGYINGAEGGSADINTTTAGQLRVSLDPDGTPTASGYAVNLAQPIVSKYFSTIVDLNVSSFGTPNASWATLGMRVSPVAYDANNVVYVQRQSSSGGVGNRIAVGATFNGAGQGELYFTTSDTSVAFKIERLDNVWRCYYSLSQYPDYVWVFLGQYEDPSEFMDSQQSVYLDAYSPGNADAQTAIGDFDNFKLYLNTNGISQEIAGDYDSSAVTADRDGSIAERTEDIISTLEVPGQDAATNVDERDVIGNKTDTIPAMSAAPGDDSIVRHVKAILERVGATAGDPDDSVLTNLGQRDDAATSDDLSDITTTSIEAKLRRILLRFSSNAFSSTVQGAASTDIETMISNLATYLSAAGAAWSVQINNNAARTNLEQVIEDLAAVIGVDGANVFDPSIAGASRTTLDAAFGAIGTALGAEYDGTPDVYDTVVTGYDSSAITENGNGSALERLEELRGSTATGTFTLTNAMGTAEQTVANYTPLKLGKIAVLLDLNTLVAAGEGGTVIARLKFMIDGVNLRTIDRADFIVGTSEVHPTVEGFVVEGANFVRVTIQANSAASVDRDIPYRIIESA